MNADGMEKQATSCYDKALTLKNAGNYKEAVAALQPLNDRKIHWGPQFQKAIALLIQLSLGNHPDVPVNSIFSAFQWTRMKVRATPHFEAGMQELVRTTLKYLVEHIEAAHSAAAAVADAPSEEEQILAALSGVSTVHRAKERYLMPVETHTQQIAVELLKFNTIGHSKKILPIYIDMAAELVGICVKYSMRRALTRIGDSIAKFFHRFLLQPIPPPSLEESKQYINTANKALEEERRDFMSITRDRSHGEKPASGPEDTVRLFCDLLEATTTVRCWSPTWAAMQFFCKLLSELVKGVLARELQIKAYETLAEVFWRCNNYTFHAHCRIIAAYLSRELSKEPEKDASRAVFAALCAPEISEEKRNFSRGYDATFENNAKIANLFDLPAAPSSSSLWLNLKKFTVLSNASADVQRLDFLIRNPVMTRESRMEALTILSQIIAGDLQLAVYEKLLHQVILQRFLESSAMTVTELDIRELMGAADDDKSVYLNWIEPCLIAECTVPIGINHKTGSLSFYSTTHSNVHRAFTALASTVDIIPPGTRQAPTITFQDLQRVQERTVMTHQLQSSCEDRAKDRLKIAEDELRIAQQAAVAQRVAEEEKRKEAAKQAQEARLQAEYQERENQERRRIVVQRLKDKYKGFHVEDSVIMRSANDFVTELTQQLKAFQQRMLTEKSADVQKMNNFERACRELELPKRMEIEEMERKKNKEERAAARENFLEQHRKEFERRQRDKLELRRYLDSARKFEEQNVKVADKTSKRDAQQQLLEQEKRRLENMDESGH